MALEKVNWRVVIRVFHDAHQFRDVQRFSGYVKFSELIYVAGT